MALLITNCGIAIPRTTAETPRPKLLREGFRAALLPGPVYRFGLEVFGSKAALQQILDQTAANKSIALRDGHSMTVHHMLYDRKWQAGAGDSYVQGPACPKGCQAALRKPGALFFEIGANIGMGTTFAALRVPGVRTVAVEASPTNAFLLKWNLFSNGFTNETQHVVKYGAMSTVSGETVSFDDCGNSWQAGARGSSPAEQKDWKKSDCVPRTVPTLTLPDIMREHSVRRITLLRQDCESCELETIPAWKRAGLIDSIGWWTGEFHHFARTAADATEAEKILCEMLKQSPCAPERSLTVWSPGLNTCSTLLKKGSEDLKRLCPHSGESEADQEGAKQQPGSKHKQQKGAYSSSKKGTPSGKYGKRPLAGSKKGEDRISVV